MVTTSPDNLWSPNATDPYNLTTDLATMQTSVQNALTNRPRTYRTDLTDAQRLALSGGELFEGLTVRASDTKIEWTYSGGAWYVSNARIVGSVRRSATPSTFPSSAYTPVGSSTLWVADVAVGTGAYAGFWKAPIAGRYRLSYEIRADGGFFSGLAINYSGSSPTLFGAATANSVQGIAAATVTITKKLSAGDEVRPYLLASSGNPNWINNVGHFSMEWVGSD